MSASTDRAGGNFDKNQKHDRMKTASHSFYSLKEHYETPLAEVMELKTAGSILGVSGQSTERYTVSPNSYGESDFE